MSTPTTPKFIMLFLLLMGAVFFIALPIFNKGDVAIKGLYIGSLSISRLNHENTQTLLSSSIEEFQNAPLVLKTLEGERVVTTPEQIGIDFMVEETIDNAFKNSRSGTMLQKLYKQTYALIIGRHESVQFSFDEYRFQNFVKSQLSPIHTPATNASFEYNYRTESFDFIPAHEGIVVDLKDLQEQVSKRMENLLIEPIDIIRMKDEPLVTNEKIGEAKETAEKILSSMPYKIEAHEESWEIEKDDLAMWIEFIPLLEESTGKYYLSAELSENLIEDYLMPLAPGLRSSAINAQFTMEGGRAVTFNISENGYDLDTTSSAKIIKNAVNKGVKTSSLVFHVVEPEITTESINELGISELIGRGESDFAGSPKSRAHNISVGSQQYQGILVGPSEEFSFNEILGPVTATEGYLPELVIKKDKTIPEYGGGLCQVSTTIFRAAVDAGFEITKRYNHSYPVAYYGTPGFDATIYPPNPDFKFKNNTPGHILIQYEIEGTKLIFEIYGTHDERTVTIDGPYTYDEKPDGSLKAWVKQTVHDASGALLLEKTFYSNYKSPSLYPVNRNPLE